MGVHLPFRRLPVRSRLALAVLACGALIAGALALPLPAAAVAGPTEYVAKTGHDTGLCRLNTSPCLTIGYALTQATNNAMIYVGGGTYAEQVQLASPITVTIAGGWTLKGGTTPATIINPTSLDQIDSDPVLFGNPYPIVDASPGSTLNLKTLTVEGSGASPTLSCDDDFLGVYYHDASGTMTTVTVDGIELPAALADCQSGTGVYVANDGLNSSAVTMNTLTVSNYQASGIQCLGFQPTFTCNVNNSRIKGTGPSPLKQPTGLWADGGNVSFTNNNVTDNSFTSPGYDGSDPFSFGTAFGILVEDSTNATIIGNKASANDVDIDLVASVTGLNPWTVKNNSATGAVNNTGSNRYNTPSFCSANGDPCAPVPFGNGVGDGLVLDGLDQVTANGNYGLNDAEYGIAVYDATTDSTINTNTAKSSGDGIFVGAGEGLGTPGSPENNTFMKDVASSNAKDGILADGGTSGNTFKSATLQNNLNYGAHDLSSGSGTAGTANTWASNSCKPPHASKPSGLC